VPLPPPPFAFLHEEVVGFGSGKWPSCDKRVKLDKAETDKREELDRILKL